MPGAHPQSDKPQGELSVRVLAMPADANPAGNIFGGWVLGQMDIAGATHAIGHIGFQVATVAVEAMKFYKPVNVGDEVSCYTRISRIGRTSITVVVETWVRRKRQGIPINVTTGTFTYVAMGDGGEPVVITNKTF